PSFPLTAPATSELHTLSLHDALPISLSPCLSSSSSSCCSPLPVAGSLASTHMPKDRAGGLTTLLLIPSFYGAIAWAAWLALYEARLIAWDPSPALADTLYVLVLGFYAVS